MLRRDYFQILDSTANSIEKRFNQQGLEMYAKLEQLVIKASSGQSTHDISSAVCSLYTDLNVFELEAELDILRQRKPEFKTYRDLVEWIKESQRHLLFRQLFNIAKLILLLPSTNATSERSFSAMGRLKTCIRSSMGQERLNSLLM